MTDPLSARLEIRLVATVGAGLLVFSVIAGILTYRWSYRDQLVRADIVQAQLVRTVQAQADVAAFAANEEIARGVLDGLLQNPVIQACRIEADVNLKMERGAHNPAQTPVDFSQGTAYPLWSPVNKTERIGTLTVLQDTAQVGAMAARYALTLSAMMLLQMLIAASIMTLVLRYLMINPVTRMAKAMRVIQPGSSARVGIEDRHARGEIGLLARSANEILNAAEVAIDEVKAQRNEIERMAARELESVNRKLAASQEELTRSEAKATLSTLVASVSHELNTPIGNSVMTASTLVDAAREFQHTVDAGALKRTDLSGFLATLRNGTALLLRNLTRAEELLSNFRQVAADQASEQRREFDLAGVIEEIVYTLTPSLKRHPHQIRLEIPAGITMDSQPGSLGQIVINLINNAYLHAFEHRTDGVLTIAAKMNGEQVELSVSDNGSGIPEENLARLFEPFFSTKIGKGGTGLGMAIVKNLVTKTLAGSIDVQSTVGGGTRFDIRLPRVLPISGGTEEIDSCYRAK